MVMVITVMAVTIIHLNMKITCHTDPKTLHSTAVLAGGYLIVSLLFNLLFCPCTSPLWNRLIGDQAMFSIIGENWANGLLPYVSTWDSKGPLIFFFNMVGHKIASGETGIFILQVLNMAGVLLISHLYMRRWCRLGHELLFQLLFMMNYVIICSYGGNQVGDSTQLLGTWAVMCAYDWSRGLELRRYAHPWGNAVIYGMFTAGCLLSRLTNSLVILTIAGIAAVILIWQGLWRNLLANILGFVLGFAIVFLPFAVYFAWHGAFGEMWYATFTYNLDYAAKSTTAQWPGISLAIHRVAFAMCLLLPLAVGVISLIDRQRRAVALVWSLAVLTALAWIVNSYCFSHYFLSFMPVLLVAFMELAAHAHAGRTAQWILGLSAAFITSWALYEACILPKLFGKDTIVEKSVELTHDIPLSDPMIAYNIDATYYRYSHHLPCYRFFCFQDWAIQNSPSLRPKVRECFKSGKAKWVLVAQYNTSAIKGLLDKDYTVYRRDVASDLLLFKRKAK